MLEHKIALYPHATTLRDSRQRLMHHRGRLRSAEPSSPTRATSLLLSSACLFISKKQNAVCKFDVSRTDDDSHGTSESEDYRRKCFARLLVHVIIPPGRQPQYRTLAAERTSSECRYRTSSIIYKHIYAYTHTHTHIHTLTHIYTHIVYYIIFIHMLYILYIL